MLEMQYVGYKTGVRNTERAAYDVLTFLNVQPYVDDLKGYFK